MASNMENFNVHAVARNDDTAGYENDITEAENNMAGAEGNVDGTEYTMPGAEENIDGTEYAIPGAEDNIDGTEYTMPEARENIDGTENTIDGIENVTDEGNENMTGANKNSENQEQAHTEDSGVKSSEKRWPGWPGESVFRILVPYQKVGGIIGRKGELIKKICEESKARIKVLDAPPSAPERAVLLDLRQHINVSLNSK